MVLKPDRTGRFNRRPVFYPVRFSKKTENLEKIVKNRKPTVQKTANRHGWTGYGPILGFPKLTVLKLKTTKSHSFQPFLSLPLTLNLNLNLTLIGLDLDLRRSWSRTNKRVEVLTSEETRSTMERRKQHQRTSWWCPLKPLFDVTVEVVYKWWSSWRDKLDLGSMCVRERDDVKLSKKWTLNKRRRNKRRRRLLLKDLATCFGFNFLFIPHISWLALDACHANVTMWSHILLSVPPLK